MYIDRPVSSGTQSYDTKKIEWPVTEPLKKLEANAQVDTWQSAYLYIEGRILFPIVPVLFYFKMYCSISVANNKGIYMRTHLHLYFSDI